MDQMIIDISEIDDVQTGDVATVIGRDGELEVTVDDIAKLADTINYNIVCGIGMRVTRVYIKDGKQDSAYSYVNPDIR